MADTKTEVRTDPALAGEVYLSPADRLLFPPSGLPGCFTLEEQGVIYCDLSPEEEREPHPFVAALFGEAVGAAQASLADALLDLFEEAEAGQRWPQRVLLVENFAPLTRAVEISSSGAAIQELAEQAKGRVAERQAEAWRLSLTVCIDLERGAAAGEPEALRLAETLAGKLAVWLEERAEVAEITVPEQSAEEVR